jgi:hypothetical protein
MMDVDAKTAIAAAKAYVATVFAGEISSAPTLEEIWLDEQNDAWSVTIGVRRSSNFVERDRPEFLDGFGVRQRSMPDYKVVRISRKDGTVQSVLNRELVNTPS